MAELAIHDLLEKAMRSTRRAFEIEEDALGVSARAWKDIYSLGIHLGWTSAVSSSTYMVVHKVGSSG